MSVIYYYGTEGHHEHEGFTDIERFWSCLRHFFEERLRAQVFELQPGDRTRYRFAIAQESTRCVVVTMLVPEIYAIEIDPVREMAPIPADLRTKESYASAIFADVVSAVVYGTKERYYDYVRCEPRWMSRRLGPQLG